MEVSARSSLGIGLIGLVIVAGLTLPFLFGDANLGSAVAVTYVLATTIPIFVLIWWLPLNVFLLITFSSRTPRSFSKHAFIPRILQGISIVSMIPDALVLFFAIAFARIYWADRTNWPYLYEMGQVTSWLKDGRWFHVLYPLLLISLSSLFLFMKSAFFPTTQAV